MGCFLVIIILRVSQYQCLVCMCIFSIVGTLDITRDMTRQYKGMQEELLNRINQLEGTIQVWQTPASITESKSKIENRNDNKQGADWSLFKTCSPSFSRIREDERFTTQCENQKVDG